MIDTAHPAAALLAECRTLGIHLTLGDHDELIVDAPKGMLTASLLAKLRAHKPALVSALKGSSWWPELAQTAPQLVSQITVGAARFRASAVDASGMVRYLSDVELAAWLRDSQHQPEGDGTAQTVDDSPTALWETAEEPGDGCPRCGSLASWWSLTNTRRCLTCEPPTKSHHLLDAVAKARKASKPKTNTGRCVQHPVR